MIHQNDILDCLFCNIAKGSIPAKRVGESVNSIAFNDINPQAPVHILIIPKIHIASNLDLNENNIHFLSDMALLANKISIEFCLHKSGYRWIMNTGEDGGQTVHHMHLHLLAGRKLSWPPG